MTVQTLENEEEFRTFLREVQKDWDDESLQASGGQLLGWLARGDGIAFYQASALDKSDLGSWKIVSYGGSFAQLVVDAAKQLHTPGNGEPPERLPDNIPQGAINWQYVLKAKYRRHAN